MTVAAKILISPAAALLLGLSSVGAAPAVSSGPSATVAVQVAPGEQKSAKTVAPRPGLYRGTMLRNGKPLAERQVSFRVTKGGAKIKGFRALISMYCYVGPPTYTQIIPTAIKAPAAKIRNRKVDRGWTDVVRSGDSSTGLDGRMKITFKKGRVATGRIAVDFGSCGTTTGSPSGYVPFKVKRK